MFERKKIYKLMTYRFVAFAKTHYATLLGIKFGGNQLYKVMPAFIVYFDLK